jgi:hypothetical protein
MNALHFAGADWMVAASELAPALLQDLLDCGTPGQDASDAVAYVRQTYAVTGDPADCAAYLRTMGAWDEDELADHDVNLGRLVWLTGCDLREQGEAYFCNY